MEVESVRQSKDFLELTLFSTIDCHWHRSIEVQQQRQQQRDFHLMTKMLDRYLLEKIDFFHQFYALLSLNSNSQ